MECTICHSPFSRLDALKRHKVSCKGLMPLPKQYPHSPVIHQDQYSGMNFNVQLVAPFTTCISGMTQSGKSTLVKEILLRRDQIIKTSDGTGMARITYCYTEFQPSLFGLLKSRIPKIQFHRGLPEECHDGSDKSSLIILDDLMHEAGKKTDVGAAFTRTSHHRNVSVIILVQNFFHKNLREITSNCHYLALMKNPRDSQFIACLGRQMNAGKKNLAMELAYKECMAKPYGYLFIDLTQSQNDLFRIRDSIFPEEAHLFVNDGRNSNVKKLRLIPVWEYDKLVEESSTYLEPKESEIPSTKVKFDVQVYYQRFGGALDKGKYDAQDFYQKFSGALDRGKYDAQDYYHKFNGAFDNSIHGRLLREKEEILQSTHHFSEVKIMLLQDILRRLSDYEKQVKETPVLIKLTSDENKTSIEDEPKEGVKAVSTFEFSKFSKTAQSMLQFFLDNNASLDGSKVMFNNEHMPQMIFEEGIRKLSDGRCKVERLTYSKIVAFLSERKFPLDMIPIPHRYLFQMQDTQMRTSKRKASSELETPRRRAGNQLSEAARKRLHEELKTWEDFDIPD